MQTTIPADLRDLKARLDQWRATRKHPTAEHQVNAIKKLEEFTTARQMETFAASSPAMLM